MGRAENRRRAKAMGSESLSVRSKAYQQMRQEIQDKATYIAAIDAIEMFFSASVVALHDKFDFGELQKFIAETMNQVYCISADKVKRAEMLELARELSGMQFDVRAEMEKRCMIPKQKEDAPQ